MDDLPHQIRERANGSCEFISPVGRVARIFAEEGHSKIITVHFERALGDAFAQQIFAAAGPKCSRKIGFAFGAHERDPSVTALILSSGQNWPTVVDSANQRAPESFRLSVGSWLRCLGLSLVLGRRRVVLLRVDSVQIINIPTKSRFEFDYVKGAFQFSEKA